MPPGATRLLEKPFIHVLMQKYRGCRCDWCFLRPDPAEGVVLKACTACNSVKYCNRDCQRKDWKVHKAECPCLKAVQPKIPMDSVRLLLRLIIKAKLQDSPELTGNPKWDRTLNDLMTHAADIQADAARCEKFAQMLFTLKELAGDRLDLPAADDIFQLYCKMTINSFTICDGEMQGLGTGMYLCASRLDHSCRPNAAVIFYGTTLAVRTLTDLEEDDPSKIFVSYIDQLMTTAERRKQLWDQYYFQCQCSLCQDTARDLAVTSVSCPSCHHGLVHVTDGKPGSCQSSGCRFCGNSEAGVELERKICLCNDQLKLAEEQKKNKDMQSVLDTCSSCLQGPGKVLNRFNLCRLRLLDLAMDAALDLEHWQEGLKYGRETLEPYRQLLGKLSPVYVVQLMKVGKLQLYLKEIVKANTTLLDTEELLRVTHGTSHELYGDLQELIQQCKAELAANWDYYMEHQ